MKPTKNTEVMKAYDRSRPGREALFDNGCRSMECTEDKAGIVWERFVTPHGVSLILFATPSWWEVFCPLTSNATVHATVAAIIAVTKKPMEDV